MSLGEMDNGKPSWPTFHYGQEDLAERSREPELYEREYYPLNHLYCPAETLRRYAGLPKGRPVPWASHTIIKFFDLPKREELPEEACSTASQRLMNSGMPILFPLDESRGEDLRRLGCQEVYEVGSMFHYARELYHRKWGEGEPAERRGTIALPDKSDLGKILDFDRETYAEKLLSLPEAYQPVYVSMHWRDYERGCHEPYLRAGLPVVCAGHPNDPLFHERLYDTFRNFTYSCSNEISSSFALSVLSGCRFFYLDGGDVTIERPEKPFYEGREPTLDSPVKKQCLDASPFPPERTNDERQQELACRYSGAHFVREPEFFREKWKIGRDILSNRVQPTDMGLRSAEDGEEFIHWLPWGFDRDGWADPRCGLEVPSREGFDRVVVDLVFPPFSEAQVERTLKMTMDGDSATTTCHNLEGDRLAVVVPTGPDGTRREVLFEGPPAVRIGNENRDRSFRILGIRWHQSTESNPDDSTRDSRWWDRWLPRRIRQRKEIE